MQTDINTQSERQTDIDTQSERPSDTCLIRVNFGRLAADFKKRCRHGVMFTCTETETGLFVIVEGCFSFPCMGERRGAYRALVGKCERKTPLGRPERKGEDVIKMDL